MENEIQLVFRFLFSWRNWKTNYLNRSRLTLWLFSQVWSTRYWKGGSCQVPWYFPCFPNVAPKVIHKHFKYCQNWFKNYAKALKNKCERFYTLLSCQDNTDHLEYLFMFKQIVPALSNIASLKVADINSYHTFSFFHYGYLVQVKKAPAQYNMFQFLRNLIVKFCDKMKQPAHPPPVFAKVVEITRKKSGLNRNFKNKTLAQVFSCEFCEISKNTLS